MVDVWFYWPVDELVKNVVEFKNMSATCLG